MPQSLTFLFKRSFEMIPIDDIDNVPTLVRGIYVLYKAGKGRVKDVVYVGMARGEKTGVKGRLRMHKKTKGSLWTHASVYEVWDNISSQQVEELEGLFRHIYRHDSTANQLNKQKAYAPLRKLARLNASHE